MLIYRATCSMTNSSALRSRAGRSSDEGMDEMSAEDLREMRGDRSAQEFGQFVADVMGKSRSYTAQEIWNWENGLRPVPSRVATALRMHERKTWLIVPYGDEFLLRMACPTCDTRHPQIEESPRAATIRFSCGAAERLANRERKVLGTCKHLKKED